MVNDVNEKIQHNKLLQIFNIIFHIQKCII